VSVLSSTGTVFVSVLSSTGTVFVSVLSSTGTVFVALLLPICGPVTVYVALLPATRPLIVFVTVR